MNVNTVGLMFFIFFGGYIAMTTMVNAIQPQLGTSPPTFVEFVFTLVIGLPLIALFWFGSKLKG